MARRKALPEPDDYDGELHAKTAVELSELLNVAYRTVLYWKKRKDFPAPKKGPYPVQKIAAWAKQMRSDSASRALFGGAPDLGTGKQLPSDQKELKRLADHEALRTRIERRIALELTNQERRGELIKRDDVEAEFTQRAIELATALRVLAKRIAPRDKKLRAKIEAEVRQLLEAYSRPLSSLARAKRKARKK